MIAMFLLRRLVTLDASVTPAQKLLYDYIDSHFYSRVKVLKVVAFSKYATSNCMDMNDLGNLKQIFPNYLNLQILMKSTLSYSLTIMKIPFDNVANQTLSMYIRMDT